MREQHGFLRDLASVATKVALQRVVGTKTARYSSSFRAFRTDLRRAFSNYRFHHVSIDVLLNWGTTRFSHVMVRHDPRRSGESQYSPWKLIAHAVNMITGFSSLPLRVASLLGFVFMLFGAGVLVYVIGVYLIVGRSVPGFVFLASTIAIFSGVQLFALGVIGEYIGRIHVGTLNRPGYIVAGDTRDALPERTGNGVADSTRRRRS